ncbi:MAG: multidrug efflux SMR transporter [Pseudomonadota bacterium]
MPFHYVTLFFAIVAETIGTTALQASQQFTKPIPTIIVVVGYCTSFYLLGITLKYMPVGIMYAVWSGLGIVLIAIIGFIIFGQRLDFWALIGISMILAGVLIIHLLSNSSTH